LNVGPATWRVSRALCQSVESGDEGSSLWHYLFARLSRGPPGARQLQHRRVLTLAKIRHQHDLPIGELQRIMMRRGPIEVDLAEASHLVG
jgi:hypothetical protein